MSYTHGTVLFVLVIINILLALGIIGAISVLHEKIDRVTKLVTKARNHAKNTDERTKGWKLEDEQ